MAEKRMRINKILTPEDKAQEKEHLLRVAAYCRVSTKSDEQYTSYETQVAVYSQKIQNEPGWTFAGIYADRGLSGTQAERQAYPRFRQHGKSEFFPSSLPLIVFEVYPDGR